MPFSIAYIIYKALWLRNAISLLDISYCQNANTWQTCWIDLSSGSTIRVLMNRIWARHEKHFWPIWKIWPAWQTRVSISFEIADMINRNVERRRREWADDFEHSILNKYHICTQMLIVLISVNTVIAFDWLPAFHRWHVDDSTSAEKRQMFDIEVLAFSRRILDGK